ncbi:MAG: phage terminase small subunit P27 family [Phycisphaerales bacterium]|nr:MAG: phage terminase small subunit P27 family [Phycisphaerales bacterium]
MLKLVAGNPGGRKLNVQEVVPPPGDAEAPEHLDERARLVWDQVVPKLTRIGLARSVDGEALARYCQMIVLWRDATAFIEKNGRSYPVRADSGNPKKPGKIIRFSAFPEISMVLRLSRDLLAIEREFGLTPSARSRIQVAAEKASQGDVNELKAKFFGSRPSSPKTG